MPFEATLLLGLTSIAPSPASVLLPVSHARAELDVYPRGCGKTEALGYLYQVEFVYVEN